MKHHRRGKASPVRGLRSSRYAWSAQGLALLASGCFCGGRAAAKTDRIIAAAGQETKERDVEDAVPYGDGRCYERGIGYV